jgi:hypothetical protein
MWKWIASSIVAGMVVLVPAIPSAAEDSIGHSAGEAGRAVVDESRGIYESSRDFFIKAGKSIADGAQDAYEDARDVGPQMVEDVKEGFSGGGQAPDPTKTETPATETR